MVSKSDTFLPSFNPFRVLYHKRNGANIFFSFNAAANRHNKWLRQTYKIAYSLYIFIRHYKHHGNRKGILQIIYLILLSFNDKTKLSKLQQMN